MKFKKRKLLGAWLVIGALFFVMKTMSTETGTLAYTDEESSISFTICSTKAVGSFDIPSTINNKPVTSIEDDAFGSCPDLTSVSIPSSVTSIGKYVFRFCSGLKAINVDPHNANYSSLDGVLYDKKQTRLICYPRGKDGNARISASVTRIDEGAFSDCTRMTSITMPVNATEIGSGAFRFCANLTSIDIPASITSIGPGAFYGCASLTNITIPTGIAIIPSDAFSCCIGLSSIRIPSSVTRIERAAFEGCSSLIGVTLTKGVECIEGRAFMGCGGLTSVSIPSSVTMIDAWAFAGCGGLRVIEVDPHNAKYSSLEGVLYDKNKTRLIQYPSGKSGSFSIPASVIEVGSAAFSSCRELKSVSIPSSVTDISDQAFYDCPGLTSVNLPAGVTRIGDDAFNSCSGLKAINVDPDNVNYSSLDGVLYDKKHTRLIVCPRRKESNVMISASATDIDAYSFYDCTGLVRVIIPSNVKYIGSLAFASCAGLKAIEVDPHNANYSSFEGVLYDNNKSKLIQYPGGKSGNFCIPASVTEVGKEAFSSCSDLKSVSIPSNVTSIGESSFCSCPGLKAINVNPGNTRYCSLDGVLYDKKLTKLILYPQGKGGKFIIPAGVFSIGRNAFSHCARMNSVTIPDSVTRIESGAFYSCTALTNILFPASVTSIGGEAFNCCSSLISVNFLNNAPSMGNLVFDHTASGFTVYYLEGKSGFTSPKWNGYKSQARATPP